MSNKNIEFQQIHRIECEDYFKLVYEGKSYRLDEFRKAFNDKEDIDKMLSLCDIDYRGRIQHYYDYWNELKDRVLSLSLSNIYLTEIIKNEHKIMLSNFDLYRGGKFIYKTERCLESARYYLAQSSQLVTSNNILGWNGGYYIQFWSRSLNLMTAILWYNNCFDYILQIIFLSQGMYRSMKRLGPKSKIETILKYCTLNTVLSHLDKINTTKSLELWKIVSDLSQQHEEMKELANTIKHRGGIVVKGLDIETKYRIKIQNEASDETFNSRELEEIETIKIDIDDTISKLFVENENFVTTLKKVVEKIYS